MYFAPQTLKPGYGLVSLSATTIPLEECRCWLCFASKLTINCPASLEIMHCSIFLAKRTLALHVIASMWLCHIRYCFATLALITVDQLVVLRCFVRCACYIFIFRVDLLGKQKLSARCPPVYILAKSK